MVDVEPQQAVVKHARDGRDADLAALLWIHCLQLHSNLQLMVACALKHFLPMSRDARV